MTNQKIVLFGLIVSQLIQSYQSAQVPYYQNPTDYQKYLHML